MLRASYKNQEERILLENPRIKEILELVKSWSLWE